MKFILPTLIIITLLLESSHADIECHYCGLRKICPLPYKHKAEDNEKVYCKKSCMKFDGYSEVDNRRVLVRSCGEDDINSCSKNATWFGAKGVLCQCNAANCNSSMRFYPNLFLMLLPFPLVYYVAK